MTSEDRTEAQGEQAPDRQRLIANDSPLARLPVELEVRQARLLSGIRLNALATAAAFERLHALLVEHSYGSGSAFRSAPEALGDAWSCIDGFDLLRSLADRLQGEPSPTLQPFAEEFREARNDRHHQNSRLSTVGHDRRPAFGTISWVAMDSPRHGRSFSLWPGARPGELSRNMNPLRHSLGPLPGVQAIELHSFSSTVRLQDGMVAMKTFVRALEARLAEQFSTLEAAEPLTRAGIDAVIGIHFVLESEPDSD